MTNWMERVTEKQYIGRTAQSSKSNQTQSTAVDVGIERKNLQNFLTRMCQDEASLVGFSDYLLELPDAKPDAAQGATQAKLAASLVSPEPEYFTTFG
jgi:hypothetical protein